MVVVAKVVLPATVKVPLDTKDEVAVIVPPVTIDAMRFWKKLDTAVMT